MEHLVYLALICILLICYYLKMRKVINHHWREKTELDKVRREEIKILILSKEKAVKEEKIKTERLTLQRIRKLASWFPLPNHLSQITQQLQAFITNGRIEHIIVDFTDDLLEALKTEPQETIHVQSMALEIVRVDIPVPGPVFMGRHVSGLAAIHPYNNLVLTCATTDHSVNHVIDRITKTQGYYPMEQYLKVLTREVARTAGI